MDTTILTEIATILLYAFVIPLIISVFKFKHLSKELKVLSYYLYLSAISEITAQILASYFSNNLPVFHVYTIAEFFLLGYIYHLILKDNLKNLVLYIIAGFTIFSIINSLFIQKITEFNTYARTVENILLILLSIIYFYTVLKDLKIKRLSKEPMIWINMGVLFYFSCSLFLFIFSNILLNLSMKINDVMWFVHGIFNLTLYLFITIALWLAPKKQIST